ncbi:hypothetical protein Agabi119p4_8570 [Agaricus bisporus var. burnettii]|uniref:Uncharacterized protein n=1 Tax=Agaricus bisporus var. burnettii TaxID=192524 RepID=A0A8H7C882_AGABI|nr:hypothetical protein Agabi119p4_8570 [Agaricus bisporus var. burnettii]
MHLEYGCSQYSPKLVQINPNAVVIKPVTMAICPWNTTMFGINAAQNILATSMLVWRIWRTGKEVDSCINYPKDSGLNAYRPRYARNAMRSIAESGLIYTTTVFVTFLVSASGSNAVYIAGDMVVLFVADALDSFSTSRNPESKAQDSVLLGLQQPVVLGMTFNTMSHHLDLRCSCILHYINL